jgi:hypothetical protein
LAIAELFQQAQAKFGKTGAAKSSARSYLQRSISREPKENAH